MGNKADRFLEDYPKGFTASYGTETVDESEMLDFAHKYDPQGIHTERELAESGPFGGLIASGWLTGSKLMRLLADNFLSDLSSMASPGLEQLRWVRPVYAGDELTLDVEVVDSRRSNSKPDRGVVVTSCVLKNQHDEPVLTLTATNMVRARSAA